VSSKRYWLWQSCVIFVLCCELLCWLLTYKVDLTDVVTVENIITRYAVSSTGMSCGTHFLTLTIVLQWVLSGAIVTVVAVSWFVSMPWQYAVSMSKLLINSEMQLVFGCGGSPQPCHEFRVTCVCFSLHASSSSTSNAA
jgi:hypothetical protein